MTTRASVKMRTSCCPAGETGLRRGRKRGARGHHVVDEQHGPAASPSARAGMHRDRTVKHREAAVGPHPVEGRVRTRRNSRSGQSGSPVCRASARASSADWLKRRRSIRVQCSGTGAISVSSVHQRRGGPGEPRRRRRARSPAGRHVSAPAPAAGVVTIEQRGAPPAPGPGDGRQSSQCSASPRSSPGSGAPQRSQTSPLMKGVSRQHGPHRPKSLSTCVPHCRQRGG